MSGIAVLGAGAFGTALAVALSANGPVALWGRDVGFGRENPRLPGVTLPDAVTVTDDLHAALAPVVLVAIPAQALAAFLAEHAPALDGRAVVSCAKGIDLSTGRSPAGLIAQACPAALRQAPRPGSRSASRCPFAPRAPRPRGRSPPPRP